MRWEKEGGTRPSPRYVRRIAELTGEPEETFSDEDDEEDDAMFTALVQQLRRVARAEAERVLATANRERERA